LSVTAAILFTGLIIVQTAAPKPALAQAGVAAGGLVVVKGQVDTVSDLVYILDPVAQRLNVYGLNPDTNVIEFIQQIDTRVPAAPARPRRR
jgi:hypothetical protein